MNSDYSIGEHSTVVTLKRNSSRVETQPLDKQTFEALYAEYLPKVYNYVCYRVDDVKTAEDITAEVFERALAHLQSYRADKGAFSTWIFRIAHNLISNRFRSARRQPDVVDIDSLPDLQMSSDSPEQAAIESEWVHHLRACMRQLPERDQEVLALKFGSGLGNQEIAGALKIKPNHVAVILHRALQQLRLAMEEQPGGGQ